MIVHSLCSHITLKSLFVDEMTKSKCHTLQLTKPVYTLVYKRVIYIIHMYYVCIYIYTFNCYI